MLIVTPIYVLNEEQQRAKKEEERANKVTELSKTKDQLLRTQNKTIQDLETKLKEQPKVVYREKQTFVTSDSSRHLTPVQIKRLTRMFSALDKRVEVAVRTVAENQGAIQYASEINDTLMPAET